MWNAADEVSPTIQNTSSCQPESHPRRGKREKRLSTRSKGPNARRQMWGVSLAAQKNGGFVRRRQTTQVDPACGTTYVRCAGLQRQLLAVTAGRRAFREHSSALFKLTQQRVPKWSGSSLPKSINNTDGVWSQYLAARQIVISSIKVHKCQERKKRQIELQYHCTEEARFQ